MLKSLICLALLAKAIFNLPFYYQNDYDVKFEIVEATWFNHCYFTEFKWYLGWHNRSTRVINADFNVLREANSTILTEIQAYKFMSNEYRFFPITLAVNLCAEYYRNNFGARGLLNKTSNVCSCPFPRGQYRIRNLVIDFSTFPPYIPRGKYKFTAKILYPKDVVAGVDVYTSVVDKPWKWN